MDVIYISSACNPNKVEEINKTSIKKLEVSGVKFHNLLMQGLSKNDVNVISLIGLPISKKTNKKIFWKKNVEKCDNIMYHQVGFINIPVLKQITVAIGIMRNYITYAKRNQDICTIIDASYVTVMPFILLANKFLRTKIIGIVADIYDYMCNVNNNNGKCKSVSNWFKQKNQKMYLKMDGFILLTEQMNEVINLNNKPYIVIEGCSDYDMKNVNVCKKNPKNVIMYAGKLAEKFGIKLLVEGFKQANLEDSELWIYGDGEEKEYVEKETMTNTNIKYMGMVSNDEIVKAQLSASLLVNTRPTNNEYTKYSFPSKNIEYMASGTPMLTTKLPGMPKEYYDYVYLIEKENVEGIRECFKKIFAETSKDELINKGKKAKEFIISKKNNYIQASKIKEFITEKIQKNKERKA